ncbi:exonuclease domain-containing protein [Trichoderma breve]|uniref:RNA exonuclease 4 n=1 Tax=Trichoderma breve TaxID=2034170 RepID=A0A9W9E4X5_9HYPO|nr:exonuclease domain-containing protein [Trichoderma breve]KAJ4857495.1 exonuclease domain-containing protein [Trichoderma breve]
MAELSSNWKKLQAQLKAEAASKPSTKRKAEEQLQSSPRKKPFETTKTKASKPLIRKDKPPVRRMGGVQSSAAIEKPKQTPSPSLAIWAEDHGVSAEDLAEAGLEIGKYVAIDCEMVGVGPGGHESALARISIVDFHGRQVYDSYVKPKERVTNWRTAVSGISQKEMRFARDFDEVQKEVSDILQDRILIGHDIKHDLDALKLSHSLKNIRDTAKYPAFKKYGHGRKPALKILAKEILGIEIQSGPHSSTEDARATMLLFRKHKSGFDMDHVNRFAPKQPANAGTSRLKKKTKKKT